MSPLFDGSRWDRLRRFGYFAAEQVGPVRVGFNVALYALPLPRVGLYFEEQTVSVSVSLDTRSLSDDVVSVFASVNLPAPLADALDRVLP